jgi:hypothetical protein
LPIPGNYNEIVNQKAWESSMKYKVSLQETSEVCAVWVPGLPGCWFQGKTEKDAVENIKDELYG